MCAHGSISSVLDVNYSPTGKEVVSASFDKSIPVAKVEVGKNNKDIQHVICVKWTADSQYVWV